MNKDLRNTVVWFILAGSLLIIAFWRAQVTVLQDAADAHQELPPPVKTRHADRPNTPATDLDPTSRFTAALAKGTPPPELRWIAEDFQNAALDGAPEPLTLETLLARRAAQHQWYRDLLCELLTLTADQKASVDLHLSDQLKAASQKFSESSSPPFEHEGKFYQVVTPGQIAEVIEAHRWLSAEGAHPENLCDLASAQREILSQDPPPLALSGQSEQLTVDSLIRMHPGRVRLLLLLQPDHLATLLSAEGP